MRRLKYVVVVAALAAASGLVAVAPPASAAGGPLVSAGSVRLSSLVGVTGAEGLSAPELPNGKEAEEDGGAPGGGTTAGGPSVRAGRVAAAGREVRTTFEGLNHRDNRLANGGNQFSSEPPDQALCVGPGHVLEGVNTVMRVYDKTGAPVTDTVSYNEFFGYPPSIDRETGAFGAFLTDPVCHYDPGSRRFFMAVLTLDQDADTGTFTGKNRLDIAVSRTSDPTGEWNLFKLPVQNDGTEGTPDHGCSKDPGGDPLVTNPSACIGDYPHIGTDRYGVYLTTNEYSFLGDGADGGALYTGSQIYAISKKQLVAGAASPTIVLFESPKLGPFRSFTVWPAVSPKGEESRDAGGTEYFLSSTLGDGSETGNTAPSEDRIGVWALTNTSSLDSATPSVRLSNRLLRAAEYALPPLATQKDGPAPQRDCLNDRSDLFGPGLGCWSLLLDAPPAQVQVTAKLDAGDTRMQQVVFADGKLYGALSTAVDTGTTRAGVLWVQVDPSISRGRVRAEVERTGYIGLADNDVTYPAIGVTSSGRVVVASTLTGDDHHPSAAYTEISRGGRPTVKVISEGKGVQDGFTGYPDIGGNRPRWGDYGATAWDGGSLWLASESIEQSCTLDEWLATPLGSCDGTRTVLANWSTRITRLTL
jgi:hypothetical protein